MEQSVVIKLKGELHRGFWLTLEIEESGKFNYAQLTGNLPPAIDLIEEYQKWQSIYRKLEYSLRLQNKLENSLTEQGAPIERFKKDYVDKKRKECQQAEVELKNHFNKWLKSRGFAEITNKLKQELKRDCQVTILIKGESKTIELLPWHLWDLLEEYSNAEIIFNSLRSQISLTKNMSEQIKILVVLGNSSENNLVKYKKKFLEELTDSKIVFLQEPTPEEFQKHIWQEQCHIFIFAGESQDFCQRGIIHINQKDSLSIKELKEDLKIAVARGLQLAIFNSCDGLGLAMDLQELNIPNAIVMREPLPDSILHQFASDFLLLLAQGMPLHLAVRAVREILRAQESEYPSVNWLPVIFQNTNSSTFTWSDLQDRSRSYNPEELPTIKEPVEQIAALTVKSEGKQLVPVSPSQVQISDSLVKGSENERIKNNFIKKGKEKQELTATLIASSILVNLFVLGSLLFVRLAESKSFISIDSASQTTSKSLNSEVKLSLDNSQEKNNNFPRSSVKTLQVQFFDNPDLLLQEIEKKQIAIDDNWWIEKQLIIAQKQFPRDYRFTYKLIKFKIDPTETEHDRDLQLLKKAAVIAIQSDRTEQLLAEMKRDRIEVRNMRKLYLDHREWDLIVEALEEKDINLVRRLQF